ILRRRMHGLYLTRKCGDIVELSRELLGLHCWFHRNVAFSALVRGAEIGGWKTALTKTWLYRGTLHGVAYDDLPRLLALHPFTGYPKWLLGGAQTQEIADEVVRCMEDGIYSRAEMRRIFADRYDEEIIGRIFSSWGGIFVSLAQRGKVAFRDMASRDFDLIDAEPTQTAEEVLPGLLRRYFEAYGPATLADAAYFFGLGREEATSLNFSRMSQSEAKKKLQVFGLEEYERFELGRSTYYCVGGGADMGDIPELTLLSGFDPLIVSYTERGAVLPPEYKKKVVLSSGICLPTIAVNGKIAGLWNIKKGEPVTEFFESVPKRVEKAARERVDDIRWRTAGRL
ncbi:MAG: winged helix DNA-binding domain-containing protein, partial [Oscillospiraceae bacterium]|nr:winged helix DNA-binding domain-containing protein [Oscillospiraceae bacterium]